MSETPVGYCQCGCGQKTNISPRTNRCWGHVRGKPCRFVAGHNLKVTYAKLHPQTPEQRFWAKVERTDGCWIWKAARNPAGYGMFGTGPRGTRIVLAHRYSFELAYGPIPHGILICHHCDNPACVRPDHLFAGTNSDNMKDSAKKHRNAGQRHPEMRQGENHGMAKLTENDVLTIRKLSQEGWPGIAIARRFSITPTHISKIVRHLAWRHIP